jgi:hypothetical protein
MPSYYGGLQMYHPSYQSRSQWGQGGGGQSFDFDNLYEKFQGSEGYRLLQNLANRGGTSASTMERLGAPAMQFYQKGMDAKDPMGLLANLRGYASKRYGQAARGIHEGYNQASRQMREGRGGLQAGGVNPAMDRYSNMLLGANRAGAKGNVWAELSNAEQQLRQGALESTGQYRKGMADAMREYATGVAGATGTDQAQQLAASSQLAGLELGSMTDMSRLIQMMLQPYMQSGARFSGFDKEQLMEFLGNMLGGGE